jgi:hypothetical protein
MAYAIPELRLLGSAQTVVLVGTSNTTDPDLKCRFSDPFTPLQSDIVEGW